MTKTKTSYKPKITENDVKKVVKDYLTIKGWFHFHVLQGLGAYKGIPDIIAIKGGNTFPRVLFIEVKKPMGKQSQYQKDFENNIKSQGGEYVLVRCLEDLIKANV
jgi:hypothetical protein